MVVAIGAEVTLPFYPQYPHLSMFRSLMVVAIGAEVTLPFYPQYPHLSKFMTLMVVAGGQRIPYRSTLSILISPCLGP